MKRALVVLSILLFLMQGLSGARTIVDFGGCGTEAVVILEGPGFETVASLSIPVERHIYDARMNVSAVLPDGLTPGCPAGVRILLDDSVLWEFNGTDFGGLGMQDAFVNGTAEWRAPFGDYGGTSSTKFRIPKEAEVERAAVEVGCDQPVSFMQYADLGGESAGNWFAESVSGAGDVNGDGFDDVIVGAYEFNGTGTKVGRAYIYFGAVSMDRNADVILTGEGSQNYFGASVSGAGDVNKDGYDDVIVGAYGNSAGGSFAGRAYIFFGGVGMDTVPDVILTGVASESRLGIAVSGAGDVNGDGYSDVIVGAHTYRVASKSAGRAYVYFGGAAMDSAADVVMPGFNDSFFGTAVAGGGDVNRDGYDDVIVGTMGYGVFIYHGGASMDNVTDVYLNELWDSDNYGRSVSNAGDVNNDGYDDVVIGAALANVTGRVFIYFGGSPMDTTADARLAGRDSSEYFGAFVSGDFDINRDGYGDVIVGVPGYSTEEYYVGAAHVYYGGPSVNASADEIVVGKGPDEILGSSVSGAGDVNGDGRHEVIVGAKGNSSAGAYTGAAYIYHQGGPGLRDPGLVVGKDLVWNRTRYFNGTATTDDFAPQLNAYLDNATASGSDGYGNSYVDVPVRARANSTGNLSLGRLKITYRYERSVPEFGATLAGYVAAHRAGKDASGNLSVPIKVKSRSPGRLKLLDLRINVNDAPTLVRPIPDLAIDEDTRSADLVNVQDYFEDDHELKSQLNFSLVSATNSTAVRVELAANKFISVDAEGGPENDNWTGRIDVVVACTDRWGLTARSNGFAIIVRNVNDPPWITSTPDRNAEAGVPYRYNVSAVDAEGDRRLYSLRDAPGGMGVDERSGAVSWLPTTRGAHNVTVAVSDGQASTLQSFTIGVPNKPPRITSEPRLNATTGSPYIYNVSVADDNLDDLMYTISENIVGLSIGPSNGTIAWTPGYTGDFHVIVRVSDGMSTAVQEFTVRVAQGNRAPRLQSSPISTAIVGLSYKYNATASDLDGDTLSFSLAQSPEGMAVDNATGRIGWTPVSAGTFPVKLLVSDGRGGEAAQEFSVRVTDRTRPKVEINAPPEAGKVRGKITVKGTATKGSLGIDNIQLRVDSGVWTEASGTLNWTCTLDTTKLKNGKHTIQVRAFDGMDYSDIVNRTVTVDNQKSKGLIPGFTGFMVLLAAPAGILLLRRGTNLLRRGTGTAWKLGNPYNLPWPSSGHWRRRKCARRWQ